MQNCDSGPFHATGMVLLYGVSVPLSGCHSNLTVAPCDKHHQQNYQPLCTTLFSSSNSRRLPRYTRYIFILSPSVTSHPRFLRSTASSQLQTKLTSYSDQDCSPFRDSTGVSKDRLHNSSVPFNDKIDTITPAAHHNRTAGRQAAFRPRQLENSTLHGL